jgi:hypothetical protein
MFNNLQKKIKKISIGKDTVNLFFIFLIKIYRKFVSPYLGNNCRFYPTCSEYAEECFKSFNVFKALYLSLYRVLRCNPLSKGGYDPVIHKH